MTSSAVSSNVRAPRILAPVLCALLFFTASARAADPGAVIERITKLCYEQSGRSPSDSATRELKNDPGLGPYYFRTIDSPDVGIDVKYALGQALGGWNDPSFAELTLRSLRSIKPGSPSAAMILVRLAGKKSHDDFAPELAAAALRGFGGSFRKNPDICAPAMETLGNYPLPVIQSALAHTIRRYGFQTALDSMREMELFDVSKQVMDSLAADENLRLDFDKRSEIIIHSINRHSEKTIKALLSPDAPVHALEQIRRALKLLITQGLLKGEPEYQQIGLTLLERFPILSDQAMEACSRLAAKSGPFAHRAKVLTEKWKSRPPPAIDIESFRLTKADKGFSIPDETIVLPENDEEKAEAQDSDKDEPGQIFPWLLLAAVAVIAAIGVKAALKSPRLRLVRRKIKILPFLLLLPAPILVFVFWKLFIETDPVLRDAMESKAEIHFISPIKLFTRRRLSNREFYVASRMSEHRYEEVPVEKTPGEIRVIGIGESPMVGGYFPKEQTFLDIAVNTVASGDPTRRYRSINTATGGGCVFDHIFRIEEYIELKPDIAVLYFASGIRQRLNELLGSVDFAEVEVKYPYRFKTADQIEQYLRELNLLVHSKSGGGGNPRDLELQNFVKRLFEFCAETLIRQLRENRIEVVIMLSASPANSPAIKEMNDIMRKLAARENLPVIDTQALFVDTIKNGESWEYYFRDQSHPERIGHAIIAGKLAPVIIEVAEAVKTDSAVN